MKALDRVCGEIASRAHSPCNIKNGGRVITNPLRFFIITQRLYMYKPQPWWWKQYIDISKYKVNVQYLEELWGFAMLEYSAGSSFFIRSWTRGWRSPSFVYSWHKYMKWSVQNNSEYKIFIILCGIYTRNPASMTIKQTLKNRRQYLHYDMAK